jgi:hypothetical protein
MKASRCPPGVFCFTPEVFLFIIFVLVGCLGALAYMNSTQQQQAPLTYVQRPRIPEPSPTVVVNAGGDDRYTRAPEPLRFWNAPAQMPVRGALFGVPTQGLPEQYQSYGFITTSDGQTLPLYGRRTAGRSDRYNYYTRTDSYNPIPIPIRYKGRDCQDSIGCDELFNGEHVRTVNGNDGKVNIYQYDGPMYIPGIL